MAVATFDTLKFANTLKGAGVPPQQAEAQAVAFAEIIQHNFKDLVTKEDLERAAKAARADLDRAVEKLRAEIDQLAKQFRTDHDQLAKSVKAGLEQLGRDLRHEIKEESSKLMIQITRLDGRLNQVQWMFGGLFATMLTAIGLLVRLTMTK